MTVIILNIKLITYPIKPAQHKRYDYDDTHTRLLPHRLDTHLPETEIRL